MKCKRTSDGRSYDHHTLQIMRQQAVKAVRGGQPVDSVAATLGVNKRSVFRWVAAFINGGQNALLAKPIPGRPPKLSHEQLKWIADAVHDKTPQQFRFEFGLWTLALIRQLVKRQFGVDLSTSAMYRVMKVLGFSAQKEAKISSLAAGCCFGAHMGNRDFSSHSEAGQKRGCHSVFCG